LNETGSERREIAFESLLAAAVAVVFWLVAKRMGLFEGLFSGKTLLDRFELQELLLVLLYRPGFLGHGTGGNHAATSTAEQASFRAWAGVR